jgi:hypothetical protein
LGVQAPPRADEGKTVPLSFLKRGSAPVATPTNGSRRPSPLALPEEVTAQELSLKLTYIGKMSEGVRLKAGPEALRELPDILGGLALSHVETIEPRPVELADAAPVISHAAEASQWLHAHNNATPIARHALVVLESIGAVDVSFETFVVSMLHGEIDTSGYPEYNAIVGGVASHWDESTGDMIARGIVGWGGKGVRGDTDRIGTRILTSLLKNILGSRYAVGLTSVDRPAAAAGRGGVTCGHCGFNLAHTRAMYCPKCRQRLGR